MTWTYHPTRWDNEFFHILFAYDWELFQSPAGANQWRPKNGAGSDMVPLAHSNGRREPRMLTTDLALRVDPIYGPISKRFTEDPEAFADAFARAWFKLTHRDMGPIARYLGPEVPSEELIWQDPVPAVDHELIDAADAAALKAADPRVGPHGRRARLDDVGCGILVPRQRQARWRQRRPHPPRSRRRTGRSTTPPSSRRCSKSLERRPGRVQRRPHGRQAACRSPTSSCWQATPAVEKAATDAGVQVEVTFHPGRTDATAEQTDADSFRYLEPAADGFRNYYGRSRSCRPSTCCWTARTC